MGSLPSLIIRPFSSADQTAAQQLILDGLAEHWGELDPAYNHDLHDIMASYLNQGNLFVVAESEGQLVGTGALIADGMENGRLVRISVAKTMRRRGIARHLVAHLISAARQRGYRQLRVETNDDWHDALALYRKMGFQQYDHRAGEIHMKLELEARAREASIDTSSGSSSIL